MRKKRQAIIIIGVSTAVIISGAVITIGLIANSMSKTNAEKSELIEPELSEPPLLRPTVPQKKESDVGDPEKYKLISNGKNLNESEQELLLQEVRSFIRSFNFSEAKNKLDEILVTYSLPEDHIFNQLFYDVHYLEQLSLAYNIQDIVHMVSFIKDPETFLVGFLYIDAIDRDQLFSDSESLNPDFTGGIQIKEDPENIKGSSRFSTYKMIDAVYEIKFNIEGVDLVALIRREDNKSYLESLNYYGNWWENMGDGITEDFEYFLTVEKFRSLYIDN